MPKPKSKPKRPYQGFKWRVHVPALWEADKGKIQGAAKLLQLPSKDENGFAFYVQSLAEHYHGEPGVTASAAELKRALDRCSKALTEATNAWIALHDSEIRGLRLGMLAAIKETYQEVYGEAFANGSGLRPSDLFNTDESALHRLENMVATTAKRIVPDKSGPPPEPRFGLAVEVFAIARYATMRKLTFGAAARAEGRRTDDYRACVLMMQAVDDALDDSQCEGPLEIAMKGSAGREKRKRKQLTTAQTRVTGKRRA